MIYLRTIFSAPNEIKYLKLNLREAYPFIEKFIICEFNRTHVGEEKELIFENYFHSFTEEEQKKIIYIGADISAHTVMAKGDNNLAHKNEQLMRGYFASQLDLKGDDIIFAVDADEIVFGQYYEKITAKMRWPWVQAIRLPMFQFFYRADYLWENLIITAAAASRVKCYKNNYPAQWRDKGKLFKETVGCHFSWCLTIDEMIAKLQTYAHQSDYGHLAKREILKDAVKNKTYPFDPAVDFRIKVLNIHKDTGYYPPKIYTMLDEFKEILG